MANKSISQLTASASNLASANVLPVVQTTGVGPVKMTGLQLAGGLLGSATFNGSIVSTSQPVLNLSQTWNDGAGGTVTFTGLKFNATDTASASGSLLLDLQVGGASLVNINKTGFGKFIGGLTAYNGVSNAQMIQLSNQLWLGTDTSQAYFYSTGYNAPIFSVSNPHVVVRSDFNYAWSSGPSASGGPDLFLRRAAAASLQLGAADAAGSAIAINSVASNQLTLASNHGLSNGAAIIITGTAAPSGTTLNTLYYARSISAAVIELYDTYQNAITTSGTTGRVSVTTAGTSASVCLSTPFQTFQPQSFTGTDIPGQPFIINGSRGTGTGPGGDIIFRSALPGTTGTSQNTLIANLIINGSGGITGQDGTTANTLALRNGLNAQTLNVYQGYVDASNYSRLALKMSGANAIISGENAGTGQALDIFINGVNLRFATGATDRWKIDSSGHFIAGTDNTYDIGASGANRPRNVYVANQGYFNGSLYLQGGGGSFHDIRIGDTTATSLILWNSNATNFGLLKFGGTDANYPALKRSGAALIVRLANDTADAALSASQLTASSTTANTSAIASTGYNLTGSSAVSMVDLAGTWNTSGTPTGIKLNITDTASNVSSLLIDLGTGGGTYSSKFSVNKSGVMTVNNATFTRSSADNFTISSTDGYQRVLAYSIGDTNSSVRIGDVGVASTPVRLGVGSGTSIGFCSGATVASPGAYDTILSRAAAAALQLGAADAVDATSPVAQTLQVQSAVAGASATTVSISGTALSIAGTITGTIRVGHTVTGTGVSAGTVIQSGSGNNWVVNNSQTVGPVTMYFNKTGANFTINGSRGSGPSAGGDIIFQVAPAGSAATTALNAYSTALTIASSRAATFAASVNVGSFSYWASDKAAINQNGTGDFTAATGGEFSFGSTGVNTPDTKILRYAAGVLSFSGSTSTTAAATLYNAYTYAGLPTAAAGMVVYISDASNAAPAWGDTVTTGGGTTKVLCWYNGTNWTVIGK